MQVLYPPPQHLRRDAKQQAAALAQYTKTLARFDEPTLRAAWQTVIAEHAFWVWPNPGTVAAACLRHMPPPPELSDQEQRRHQALALADAYTARFMKTTHLARLAASEGWAPRLREYVRDAAWVQAQLICGVRAIGFATALVPEEDCHLSAREWFPRYRETIAGAVERGTIRVAIPPTRRREWQGEEVDRGGAKRIVC